MNRRARRSRSSSTSGSVGYSREFLERLARILVRSGHSPKALMREFQEICRHMKEPRVTWDPDRLNYVSDLPHVIAQWHSDPQYLDSHGAPRPLPLQGRGPALGKLIRRVLPAADPQRVVQSFIDLRGISQRGELYIPRSRHLVYTAETLSAQAHGLTALLGMLGTLDRNIWGKPRGALFERAAMNPNFPVRSRRAFDAAFKPQADTFVWGVDRQMRTYEQRARPGRTTRLGVCVFVFENPNTSERSQRVRKRQGRVSRVRRLR